MKMIFTMRLSFCFLAAIALPLGTVTALDLTPHSDFKYGNEGPPIPVLEFVDGAKKITWATPHEWLAEGGGRSLSLSAPGDTGAWMKLLVVPISKDAPEPVTDASASTDDIQAWPRQYLPAGAQDVAFIKMVASPFTVCTHPATEYIFNYARYGSKQTVSIVAVEFSDTERLVVVYAANVKNFDQVRQAVIASMFTWQYK